MMDEWIIVKKYADTAILQTKFGSEVSNRFCDIQVEVSASIGGDDCKEMAQYIVDRLNQRPQGWVSVETPPKSGEQVLVCSDHGDWQEYWVTGYDRHWPANNITDWQPITPPEDK